ncbi:MAG: hypothetical protein ACI8T1_001374 [Verrucomicrobiales bacterium]|jgi:hypothetical protein
MKRLFYILSTLGLLLGYTACEKQKWEESRVLHMNHDEGKEHDTAAADKGHEEAKGQEAAKPAH